jgi:hypothetical protein
MREEMNMMRDERINMLRDILIPQPSSLIGAKGYSHPSTLISHRFFSSLIPHRFFSSLIGFFL